MLESHELGAFIAVSLVLAAGGFLYIYLFSGVFSMTHLDPIDSEVGVQLSPDDSSCQVLCKTTPAGDNIFMGCRGSFTDFVCGVSCKGIITTGVDRGDLARVGVTLCYDADCVCDA